MRALVSLGALLIAACGAAAPPPPSALADGDEPEEAAPPAAFSGHGALTLRSMPPSPEVGEASPPLYAELEADGSVVGTRCGATRFTDEGTLEREGTVVARIVDGGIARADGSTTGWHLEDGALVVTGGGRFTMAGATITPSDEQLPAVQVQPTDADPRVALALLATLLVCDDAGP